MPFLRVVRDKRGYETTYLMDMYRDGNRQRSRILYAFRSPSNVRVGRVPLQRDSIRQIEEQHRDITFDWKAVLESCQVIDSTAESRVPRRRKKVEPSNEPVEIPSAEAEGQAATTADTSGAPSVAIPALLEGTTAEEQSAFLACWYPIVRDRIPRYTADPARREALFSLAERLNPAEWSDADEVASGLQQAAEALERLSLVLTKRRRRRSRRSPRPTEPSGQEGAPTGDTDTSPQTGSLVPES